MNKLIGWQPIETAPRDGSYFIIYSGKEKHPRIEIAKWRCAYKYEKLDDHWLISEQNDYEYADYILLEEATHWMPLPNPPEDK